MNRRRANQLVSKNRNKRTLLTRIKKTRMANKSKSIKEKPGAQIKQKKTMKRTLMVSIIFKISYRAEKKQKQSGQHLAISRYSTNFSAKSQDSMLRSNKQK